MDITRDPIPALIRRIAVPASLGYFFNTLFNVVDTFYAGRLSTDSLAALSLSFPIYFIILSIAIGIQSGGAALIANSLGEGNRSRAVLYQSQAIILALVSTALVAVPLFFALPLIFRFFGAQGRVLEGGLRYMRVIVGGSVLIILANTINAGLQARGNTRSWRNLLIVMSLANLLLDPVLMFGLEFRGIRVIPRLEEAGTALATVILFGVGGCYVLREARKAGAFEGARQSDFFPRRDILGDLVRQALPATLNFLVMTLGSFVINFFISRFGRDPLAAYGAALRIEQIALLPLLGINVALATVVAQNNGAGRLDRVQESFSWSLRCALVVTVAVLTPVIALAPFLLRLFTENERVLQIGRTYLYIQVLTFFSYILINMCNSLLQGLKKPRMIVWVALYRQALAPFLVFPFLAFSLGMEERGVFWGLVLVNWSAACFSLVWARSILKGRLQLQKFPEGASDRVNCSASSALAKERIPGGQ
ncbi:putative efflux protein, MATE family [Alkalispirochaeta americana]|uniref:Putative efflux protein, MATE family n=1 Tax=Alkalispirochaeta americana TaxID=159291 RepID=A0A1N6WWA3_9SPIO|nr:MATE family efflux transporter [Alkalispirochaeta americana]SIQ94352.1 putative efflux protein, MATE family [Alkalispirochaeta americana]